ncbi:MAG: MBL fold metallo-hydrolase [Friedmanniella sp.]|jgi:ribonuclease BN (tRNA processing enzyme)
MELTIVGCSGSVPGPDSPASSYLVRAPHGGGTFSLLLDLGPGAFGALYRYLHPSQVDAIALSHLHPDHCLDVCAFYVAANYTDPGSPWPGIPVYGPEGTRERIRRAYEAPGPDPEPAPAIERYFSYRDWEPEQRIGPFVVSTARVKHPVEAFAVRLAEDIPDGGTLVFSGDTGPCDALVELASGADLLLAEAAFLDAPTNRPGLHLTGRQAAETAQAAGVSELVLTHIPPWSDADQVLAEAVPHFDGPVSLAISGARWTIGPR